MLCVISALTKAFDDLATTSKSTWSVSSAFSFGWSAFGDDTTGHGFGSACDTGDTHTPSATLTYQGFDGENTSFQFASSTSSTDVSGTNTVLCLATGQDTVLAPTGTYAATTTATAVVF